MSQAQIAAKRSVAKNFAFEVEKLCGGESAANFLNGKTKLVETELEMVRATWLLQHSAIIRRFRWLGDVDRVQRSEID
jgi:hypothetical protein